AAVRRHHLRTDDVVAGESVAAHQPTEAAAECQTGDAGGGHRAASRRETMLGGRLVEVAPRRATAGERDLARWIDDDVAHAAEVDHEPTVDARQTGGVVAATADGEREIVRPRELHRALDVRDALADRDACGPTIDHAVPHGTPRIVVGRVGKN